MAFGDFVLEDGTGLSNATSYVSLEEFVAYCQGHQQYQAIGALMSNEQRQSALMYGTRWIDNRYRWLGRVWNMGEDGSGTAQALRWPRNEIWDEDGRELVAATDDDTCPLPDRLKEAVCEAALMHHQSAVNEYAADGQLAQGPIQRVKVDTIEVEYTNDTAAGAVVRNPDKNGSRVRHITAILDGLISRVGVTR